MDMASLLFIAEYAAGINANATVGGCRGSMPEVHYSVC
jgi:hypothetical protein